MVFLLKSEYLVTYTKNYSKVDTLKEDIININLKYCTNFGMTITDKEKDLTFFMYLVPKMHKAPIGCHFIVAPKRCSTKPLTKIISNMYKMI